MPEVSFVGDDAAEGPDALDALDGAALDGAIASDGMSGSAESSDDGPATDAGGSGSPASDAPDDTGAITCPVGPPAPMSCSCGTVECLGGCTAADCASCKCAPGQLCCLKGQNVSCHAGPMCP